MGDLLKPYSIKEYGVGNDLLLPWSYRRQYCDYFYRLVKVEAPVAGNEGEWSDVSQTEPYKNDIGKYYTEMAEQFADKRVTFDVYYKVRDDIKVSTDPDNAYWYSLTNRHPQNFSQLTQENFCYIRNVNRGVRNGHYSDDWLWAVEGDPYCIKLHNRYTQKWDEMLKVNALPETIKIQDGTSVDQITGEATFQGDFSIIVPDDKVLKRGTYTTLNGLEEQPGGDTGTDASYNKSIIYRNTPYFDMMVGNYKDAFLLHPLKAEVIDSYPALFLTVFVFNAGNWMTQINEMTDREAKRNLAANWSLTQLNADQLLVYYTYRGHVGALNLYVAEQHKELFERLADGSFSTADLEAAQKIVHNKNNLEEIHEGYYRIRPISTAGLEDLRQERPTLAVTATYRVTCPILRS